MSKRKNAVIFGVILFMLLAGTAFAYWQQRADTVNILTMASYKADIVEKYQAPPYVNPSESVEKRVNVRNSGTVDILVRVSVEKMFGARNGGTFLEDKNLDGGMIEIDFHSKYWQQGKDGWFYYKEILKAGETTKEPLLDSYRLSEKAGNEYKGKEAHIVVTMESVQADESAENIWEEIRRLAISWPGEPKGRKTAVEFHGREKGFVISGDGTDLFSMFKNLTPGCSRIQKIRIKNGSDEKTEIFLHAEDNGQEGNPQQTELVRQLLYNCAQIELQEENRLLYSGPVGGAAMENPEDKKISLGSLDAGEEKELTVKLTLSPEMDNKFQKLTGKVKWVFTAGGEDETSVRGEVPVTGDGMKIWTWLVLMGAGGIILAGTVRIKRCGQRGERCGL